MNKRAYPHIRISGSLGGMAFAVLLILGPAARAEKPWTALLDPDNSLSFHFLRRDKPVFSMNLIGWGPRWAWVSMQSREKIKSDRLSVRVPFPVNKGRGETIDVRFEAWQSAAKQIAFRYDLEA